MRQALEHEGRPPVNGDAGDDLANFLSNNESRLYELRSNHPFTEHGYNVFFVEKLVIAAHLPKHSFDTTLHVKNVVTGIKTADLVLKAMKAVQGVMILLEAQGGNVSALGSPDGLILGLKAAKVVFKGVKMSQKALESHGVKSISMGDRFGNMMTGLKASWGALDLVRGSKALLFEIFSGRAVALNLFLRGYEACKGAVSTVEVLGPFKAEGVKQALKGIGVMVKACFVSKELSVLVIKGLGLSHGARAAFEFISERQDIKVRSAAESLANTSTAETLANTSRSLVKFRRKNLVNLLMNRVESVSGSAQLNLASSLSLRICHSVLSNARRLQSQSELSVLSIQGLSSI